MPELLKRLALSVLVALAFPAGAGAITPRWLTFDLGGIWHAPVRLLAEPKL